MRSFDRTMPEEINRIVTDHISTLLFPISQDDARHLLDEGIDRTKIHLAGDPMIDNLLYFKKKLSDNRNSEKHILVEIHRPANVDDKKKLTEIIIALAQLAERYRVIFPVHPRTMKMINEFDLFRYMDMIEYGDPVGYFDFHSLMMNAGCVITDSDGIQQETSVLNISCLSIRNTCNIRYTINYGTNELCPADRDCIYKQTEEKFNKQERNKYSGTLKILNDGKSSERIAKVIYEYINNRYATEWDDSFKKNYKFASPSYKDIS